MRLEPNIISQVPVFQKKNKNNSASNGLNMGVLTPPDNLPRVSLYDSLYGNQTKIQKTPFKKVGGKKLTAGKFSAFLAFSSIALSLASMIAFIKGKK